MWNRESRARVWYEYSIPSSTFQLFIVLALVAVALAEKKPEAEETKKDKRGVYGLGYGLEGGVGLGGYSSLPAIGLHQGVSTVLTKEVAVPVPQPIAVPVDRHVAVPVKVKIYFGAERNHAA